MIILGIDPGVTTTGFAVIKKIKGVQKLKVIDFGCILTSSPSAVGEKLMSIYKQINNLIVKHKPNLISVENLYFFKNIKTALPVSQAKGVILLSAAQSNLPVLEFTPLQVKMTVVGYGRAEKKQVQEMIKQLLDLRDFNFKEKGRKKDDASDALGIALCAALKNRLI